MKPSMKGEVPSSERYEPQVPIRRSGVTSLKQQYFTSPGDYPVNHDIEVGVGANLPDPTDIASRGSWHALSPEEVHGAFILRVAEAVSNSAPEDELIQWRTMALTVGFVFRSFDSKQSMLMHSLQRREHLAMDSSAMTRPAS